MDHTTIIVVANKYGRIITQVASGYNTLCHLAQKRGGKHIKYFPPLFCAEKGDFANPANGKFLPADMALSHDCESLGYSVSPSDAVACEYKHWQELIQPS
jgi:hypothetical protein